MRLSLVEMKKRIASVIPKHIDYDAESLTTVFPDIELDDNNFISSLSENDVLEYLNENDLEELFYEN